MSDSKKMIAVFEVEFDSDEMFDEASVNEEYGGDWTKAMKWLYDQEDMGIFNDPPKLVGIRERPMTSDISKKTNNLNTSDEHVEAVDIKQRSDRSEG
jgi:hypothetical protein